MSTVSGSVVPINPSYTPYEPLKGCDALVNPWCDTNCPHFTEFGSLLARYDRADKHDEKAWRCYARHTLDEAEQLYIGGKAYCTRSNQLQRIIEACAAQVEAGHAVDGATSSVAVDAGGGQHAADDADKADADAAADADEAPRIGIVVAHCKESMEWLGEVQRGLRDGYSGTSPLRLELHIYEKCDDKTEDAWPRLGWQHERRTYLANKGEECYAYLSYLRDLYHVLPDAVIFFQGDGVLDGKNFYSKSRSFSRTLLSGRYSKRSSRSLSTAADWEDFDLKTPGALAALSLASRNIGGVAVGGYPHLDNTSAASGSSSITSSNTTASVGRVRANTYRSVNDHQFIAVASSPEECSRLLLTSNCLRGPPRLFECVLELNERHGITHGVPLGLGPPRAFAMYANAQFGVSRDRILSRPLSLYENLLKEFETNRPNEQCFVLGGPKGRPHRGTCALFEYMWHTIFGEPPILDPRLTMSGVVAPQYQETFRRPQYQAEMRKLDTAS